MRLAGTRVVVTGASRGLGAEIASRVARKGARVALIARSEDAIAKLAADLGGDAYPADLADADGIGDLVDRVSADGPIDVRDALFPMLAEAPRRMTEWLLTGVDPQ